MTDAINKAMTPLEWGLLLTLSVLWGGSFFFVGVAVDALPPFTIVVLRVGLAAVALQLLLLVMRVRLPNGRRPWAAFFAMGLLNNLVPFCLIVWGQGHIASGLAAILNATTPLFTVVVAHMLTVDERLSVGRLLGVVAGLAGVVAMIGPELLDGFDLGALGQIAVLGAALSYAFAGVYGRRFRRMGISPLATATGQVTASTVLLLPVALLVERPWTLPLPGAEVWLAMLGLALFSTALAYVLYFRILATAGATNLLLVTFLIPISAVLLGALFLAERLAPAHILGMALIGLGLAAIDGRVARLLAITLAGRRRSAAS
ncbi:MAG: DMT family transporter [Alphaproteobacteria bacterium]|jgi:drug/metabolite transporter (DMT)-like permease|nr:DMT family transporter [Alphaproteobacteria bacterium]MDP6563291.1 DMT family transporter [Alphaproteobacteria bacterium]MDP6812439.1 DMT family transporter [Alphaproteobacteria bacterium]